MLAIIHTMKYIFKLCFYLPLFVAAQQISVIPLPQQIMADSGHSTARLGSFSGPSVDSTAPNGDRFTKVSACEDCDFNFILEMLTDSITRLQSFGIDGKTLIIGPDTLQIIRIKSEGYRIQITSDTIFITANTRNAINYAITSLYQIYNGSELLDSSYLHTRSYFQGPEKRLIDYSIIDYPAYNYRGMHLDVCRHFFSKDFIKRYIDLLAQYKMNVFHWHLTDDQGWRIEIKKYPRLTGVGAWRTEPDGSRYGGYYTQADIREIVAYAAERYITVIPEIEMPGHSSAALAAYPEFGCTGRHIDVPNTWGIKKDIYAPTDSTFQFFEDVMDEVCALFPSPYIHIGGDEAPKAQWHTSLPAQTVIQHQQFKNEEELQHYFMHLIESYLNKKGRTAIGWGEVVKGGLSDSMVVMSWMDKSAGIKAARHGNKVIMAPRGYCYFDYPQKGDKAKAIWMLPLPLKKVYTFSPSSGRLNDRENALIIGGEATLWTEYVKTEEQVLHQLMPRLAAIAEALWTNPAQKNFTDFKRRLSINLQK